MYFPLEPVAVRYVGRFNPDEVVVSVANDPEPDAVGGLQVVEGLVVGDR